MTTTVNTKIPRSLTKHLASGFIKGIAAVIALKHNGGNPFLNSGNYFNFASTALTASKFGKSFGVGVCSLYCTTPFLSITNAARAAVSPTPASIGNTTSYCLMTTLFRSLASVMPIFSCFAHAACANGLSTLTAMTSAPSAAYASSPAVRLHISVVQTPVNASGKNSSTVFFLPKLLLNLTSTSAGDLDLSVKSGAFEPTGMGIIIFSFEFLIVKSAVENFGSSAGACQCLASGSAVLPRRPN